MEDLDKDKLDDHLTSPPPEVEDDYDDTEDDDLWENEDEELDEPDSDDEDE